MFIIKPYHPVELMVKHSRIGTITAIDSPAKGPKTNEQITITASLISNDKKPATLGIYPQSAVVINASAENIATATIVFVFLVFCKLHLIL